MNTGVQRSGATPPAARTTTTQAVGPEPGNVVRPGQEHGADRDGARDPLRRDGDGRRPARPGGEGGARDGRARGPLPAHPRPLPARLGLCGQRTRIRVARLAKETGLFPVFEAEHGEVTSVYCDPPAGAGRGVPAAPGPLRAPVRADAPRGRARPHPGDRRPQHRPLRPAGRDARGGVMERPFAITLDVGSSLANHTGAWRDRASRLRRTAARRATAAARPARTSSAGSTCAEEGDYEGGVGGDRARRTRSRR